MGSSISGSLDKYAKLSPAAAIGSGKVKFPETGAIGAVQGEMIGRAEAKQAMNKRKVDLHSKVSGKHRRVRTG